MRKQRSAAQAGRAAFIIVVTLILVTGLGAILYMRRPKKAVIPPLSAEIYYLAIAPAEAPPVDEKSPISFLRINYYVRNSGGVEYYFPTDYQLFERNGTALKAVSSDVKIQLPLGVGPMDRQQVTIQIPYAAEYLTEDAWRLAYPEREMVPPSPSGRYARFSLPISAALQVLQRSDMTPERLLDRYEIIGEGTSREATDLARAVFRRKLPDVTGYVLRDVPNKVDIVFPVPQG